MAGLLNGPLRLAMRRFGWTTSWIGSIDAKAVVAARDGRLINILGDEELVAPEEAPLVVQLLGNDVGLLREAVALLERRVDAFDINLGCPLREVTRKGLGASLLEDPSKTTAMVRELAARSKRPVTAKIRVMPETDSQETVRLAQNLEAAGVAALVVHARQPAQGFSGRADWAALRAIRERLTIPVIANGGLTTAKDIASCCKQTGCSWVMVGAGAIRNPFLLMDYQRLAGDTAPAADAGPRLSDFANEYGRRLVSQSGAFARIFASPAGYLGHLTLRLRLALFIRRH